MQLSHVRPVVSAVFDDPNLVSAAGLVPLMALAERAGLRVLADEHLTVPGDKGANAGLKVSSLVAGMCAGADSIDDMAVLRHGGMGRVFNHGYAPSTLGSFLRGFTFGHVRQLDAVAARFLGGLARCTPLLGGIDQLVLVDVDDTIIEVHGGGKQGADFGYSGVRGLNALLATITIGGTAPVIAAQRLRRGGSGSSRGAARIVADTLATIKRLRAGRVADGSGNTAPPVLLRADSAFYAHTVVNTAIRAGAQVSVTVRMDPAVKAAIASIDETSWTTIEYPQAIHDEASGTWISRAQVAEIPFLAFRSQPKTQRVPGRLVVRRIPDANHRAGDQQASLFQVWRFHAFFTTSNLDTITADQVHRGHAIIEQVNADLKSSALAHMPSGVFNANAAWLVLAVVAFNLTRATTPTIRRKLINIPARAATSARRVTLHLPAAWPWQHAWTQLFNHTCGPPGIATI
jgi:hypothetical protein